ncbi:DUF4884 domain-containing protein [Prolixibacter bellariivorans]|uniref:DUF4884 domain-containing protein n=1 Tax=Prolixibacter bellariivorans TaxID=314319 RepID=A0A5M4B4B1_9BACT|nr:DUF4884 domain-containing protein [Prolixibacter bellariivorans]GET35009.1 DUF4884 domain-containing protein [Prolixibacter bellariivorans]
MKKIIKAFALAFIAINLLSCATGIPLSNTRSENNKTYRVQYLFQHDGCKVYRFYDEGHYVYFTNCSGETTSMVKDSTGTVRITNMIRNQSTNK